MHVNVNKKISNNNLKITLIRKHFSSGIVNESPSFHFVRNQRSNDAKSLFAYFFPLRAELIEAE